MRTDIASPNAAWWGEKRRSGNDFPDRGEKRELRLSVERLRKKVHAAFV
jgi:hypothetical protein